MPLLCSSFVRMPLGRIIGVWLIIILVLCIVFISMSQGIIFYNIKSAQEEAPKAFFTKYTEYSLKETVDAAKKMTLAVYDYRICFLNSLVQILLSNLPFSQIEITPEEKPNKVACFLTSPNETSFECKESLLLISALEEQWEVQSRRGLKRFNIFYQNKNNLRDIRIITVFPKEYAENSYNFTLDSYERINESIAEIPIGNSKHTGREKDYYNEKQNGTFCYIRTKIEFGEYQVLFELQTFLRDLGITLSRVMYSSSANIAMLWKNSSHPEGYTPFSTARPLDKPEINYLELLQYGYHEKVLQNGSIFQSYTLPYSSSYTLGNKSYFQENFNEEMVILVHSISISEESEENLYKFISMLLRNNLINLGFFFSLLFIIILATAKLVSDRIGSMIKVAKSTVQNYLAIGSLKYEKESEKLSFEGKGNVNSLDYYERNRKWLKSKENETYLRILEESIQSDRQEDFFNNFLNKLNVTICKIELKKKKMRRNESLIIKEWFPLNLHEPNFEEDQCIEDNERERILIEKIREEEKIRNNNSNNNSNNRSNNNSSNRNNNRSNDREYNG